MEDAHRSLLGHQIGVEAGRIAHQSAVVDAYKADDSLLRVVEDLEDGSNGSNVASPSLLVLFVEELLHMMLCRANPHFDVGPLRRVW